MEGMKTVRGKRREKTSREEKGEKEGREGT